MISRHLSEKYDSNCLENSKKYFFDVKKARKSGLFKFGTVFAEINIVTRIFSRREDE